MANIHAGWKGVLNKIYIKSIEILVDKFNSNVEDLIVCIGPSIRKCCFSSEDEEFRKNFLSIKRDEKKYIIYDEDKVRFHIDLIYLIKSDLIEIGVREESINVANICTCCNNEDFYSYRYKTKNKLQDYATFSTWVSLK